MLALGIFLLGLSYASAQIHCDCGVFTYDVLMGSREGSLLKALDATQVEDCLPGNGIQNCQDWCYVQGLIYEDSFDFGNLEPETGKTYGQLYCEKAISDGVNIAGYFRATSVHETMDALCGYLDYALEANYITGLFLCCTAEGNWDPLCENVDWGR